MVNYKILYEEQETLDALKECVEAGICSFDIETSAKDEYRYVLTAPFDPHLSDISTISFTCKEDMSYVVPLKHSVGYNNEMGTEEFMFQFNELIGSNKDVVCIAYNAKFEAKHMLKHNVFLNELTDPMYMILRYAQIVPDNDQGVKQSYKTKGLGLKPMTLRHFSYEMASFESTVGKKQFGELDIEEGAQYSADDSIYSLKLFNLYRDLLRSITIDDTCNGIYLGERPYKNYYDFLAGVEMPTLATIGAMEYFGVKFDKSESDRKKEKALAKQYNSRDKLIEIAESFGLKCDPGKTGKTKSVRELLFHVLDCPKAKISPKTGAASLDAESISDIKHMLEYNLSNIKELYVSEDYKQKCKDLKEDHPWKDKILDVLTLIEGIQKMGTLINNHIDGRTKFINEETGRIHATYDMITDTSRFSSAHPNAQNIPKASKDELGIRSMYIPERDHFLLLVDYAAQEVRISAEMYKDVTMQKIILEEGDMHSYTANAIFDLGLDVLNGDRADKIHRDPAKGGFFGMSYGGTAKALQGTYKTFGTYCSKQYCQNIIDGIKKAFPGMERFAEDIAAFARKHGYIETALGYRRRLNYDICRNDWERLSLDRRAANTPIQGTAADMTKVAMNRFYDKYIDGTISTEEVKIVSTIHDEIAFEIKKLPKKRIMEIVKIIRECMEENIIKGQVIPQIAEPEIADYWDIFEIGEKNGWAKKSDFFEWYDKIDE